MAMGKSFVRESLVTMVMEPSVPVEVELQIVSIIKASMDDLELLETVSPPACPSWRSGANVCAMNHG
jgi:hypothetical protein